MHLRQAAVGDGVDIYLSFGSPQDVGTLPEFDVISIDATCTNRRLAAQLKIGDLRVPTATSPAVATFTNLTTVTSPLAPPMGRELQWRVLAHMAMSYRSITEIEVLRAMVDLYNFQAIIDRQAGAREPAPARGDQVRQGAPDRSALSWGAGARRRRRHRARRGRLQRRRRDVPLRQHPQRDVLFVRFAQLVYAAHGHRIQHARGVQMGSRRAAIST